MLRDEQRARPSLGVSSKQDSAARLAPFVPEAQPGFRLPHCPLEPAGAGDQQGASAAASSSLDLCGPGWALIGSGAPWAKAWLHSSQQAWCEPAALRRIWIVAPESRSDVVKDAAANVWVDVSNSWDRVMVAGNGLLLLIRPDGHVAARIDEELLSGTVVSAEEQVRILQDMQRMLLKL